MSTGPSARPQSAPVRRCNAFGLPCRKRRTAQSRLRQCRSSRMSTAMECRSSGRRTRCTTTPRSTPGAYLPREKRNATAQTPSPNVGDPLCPCRPPRRCPPGLRRVRSLAHSPLHLKRPCCCAMLLGGSLVADAVAACCLCSVVETEVCR